MTSIELQSNPVPYVQPLRHGNMVAMFVDLDHFMRICTDDPPEAVFSLIGGFQRVVTAAISSFKGELNSYQGDGILAVFADVAGRTDCATRALRCAREILEHIQALGLGYVSISGHTTSVSIGLQYGPIWAGTIGISRRFGPTLIGDAVNVATRLEQQARRLDAQVVVGNEVIQRARQECGSHAAELEQFVNVGPLFVHGRPSPVHVWKLQTQSTNVLPDVDADAQPQPGHRAARS